MLANNRQMTSSSSLAAAFLVLLAFDAVNAQVADPMVNNCLQEVNKLISVLETAFRLDYMLIVRTIFHEDAVVVHLDKTYRGHEQIETWFRYWTRKLARGGTFERYLVATREYTVVAQGWCKNTHEVFNYYLLGVHDANFRYYIKELTFKRYDDYWGPFGRPGRPG